jgi:hypothetical protein
LYLNRIHLEWMNEKGESGLPYDFKLEFLNKSIRQVEYIEAKSTVTSDRDSFPISYQEVAFAHKNESQFVIYRLYNVMNPTNDPSKVKFKIIKNLKEVKLLMII